MYDPFWVVLSMFLNIVLLLLLIVNITWQTVFVINCNMENMFMASFECNFKPACYNDHFWVSAAVWFWYGLKFLRIVACPYNDFFPPSPPQIEIHFTRNYTFIWKDVSQVNWKLYK